MRSPSVSDRLNLVIDVVFGGNVTQAAAAVDLPAPTLSRIASRQIQSPRIATVRQIADRLGVSASWLIGERADDEEFGGLPPWRALITAYNAARGTKLRGVLHALKPKSARARRIVAAYDNIEWERQPPIPAISDLAEEPEPHDQFLTVMFREFGNLQATLLARAIERVKEIEAERDANG